MNCRNLQVPATRPYSLRLAFARLIESYRTNEDSRVAALDGLRGLAILLVFSMHFTGFYANINYFLDVTSTTYQLINLLRGGHIGVDLFFVISGYLIYLTLSNKPPDISFFRRRVYRLLPAHLFICLYIAWVTKTTDIHIFFLNIFFLAPFLNGTHIYNDVTWTLSWEWVFYVAIFIAALVSNRSALKVLALTFVISVAITEVTQHLPSIRPIGMDRFSGFLFGIFLADLVKNKRCWSSKTRSNIFAASAFVGIVGMMATWVGNAQAIQALPLQGGFFMGTSFCFMVIIHESFIDGGFAKRIFSLTPLRLLGKISYSFYLAHAVIIGTMLNKMPVATSLSGIIFGYVIVLTSTIAFASVMYFFLEKPYFQARSVRKE